jgi:hypothetical protein
MASCAVFTTGGVLCIAPAGIPCCSALIRKQASYSDHCLSSIHAGLIDINNRYLNFRAFVGQDRHGQPAHVTGNDATNRTN